ncbi:MAG: class B sortase [Lachnospiraceae bacterium]|nr:class B sortase [Lachnospiraceae bacterium]
MTYRLLNHEFSTLEAYEAARRDQRKIRSMERVGETPEEIAQHYREQITRFQISFESVVGEEFLQKVEDILANAKKPEISPEKDKPRTVISKSKKRLKTRLTLLLYIAASIFLLVVVYLGYRSFKSERELRKLQAQIHSQILQNEDNSGEMLPNMKELYDQNNDLAGWLTIPDTKIDYPVMYLADDNDFYLAHNLQKEEDLNGLLVLDKRCDRDGNGINLLIHGHNMKSGAMFGSLDDYKKKEFYEEHPFIIYSTLYEERTYEVIAVFKSSVYNDHTKDVQFYDYIRIEDEEQFDAYMTEVRDASLYETGKTAVWGDELLTLSTCEYSKQNGRLVVLARRK